MSNESIELLAITDSHVVVVRMCGHVGRDYYDQVSLFCPFGRAEEKDWWEYKANVEQLCDGWLGVARCLGFETEDEFWAWAQDQGVVSLNEPADDDRDPIGSQPSDWVPTWFEWGPSDEPPF